MTLMLTAIQALSFGLVTDPANPVPIALFLQADIVVKVVIIGLLIASIWTWAIIISFAIGLGRARKGSEKFEKEFWKSEDIDLFYEQRSDSELPSAKVLAAGVQEWRRSNGQRNVDRTGFRNRLTTLMKSTIAHEVDKRSDRLNILATISAVAPLVGLFGTVWGTMRSVTSIVAEQNGSLAVVAPGIAEALFATATGLFAAIPAVIAYNRLSHGVNQLESRLSRFADRFYTTLSRELDN